MEISAGMGVQGVTQNQTLITTIDCALKKIKFNL